MMPDRKNSAETDFESLFEAHELALRIYAKSLLPTWDAVDEVMQNASLVMWKKIDQLDSNEGFLPWGKVIVRFTSQKYFRTHSRDPHVFDPDLIDLLVKHEETMDDPRLAQREAALSQCLKALNEASRKLVLAPYMGHGHLTELAEAAGRTRNSLYKQIRRIRGKLEFCITQQIETAP